jgi:outer membrane protein
VTVGARAQAVTPYEGAGHDVVVPVPVLNLLRPGAIEHPNFADDAANLTALHLGRLSLGVNARLRGARKSDGDYAGLPEVGRAFEAGVMANLWATDWFRLHASVMRGLTGNSGWVADVSADLAFRRGPGTIGFGPRVGFGNQDYMHTYFGLTDAEAAANPAVSRLGLGGYAPGGGLRYVGAGFTGAWRWTPHWRSTANFYYHRLGDIGSDSPIVKALGSPHEFFGGVGLRYTFRYGG